MSKGILLSFNSFPRGGENPFNVQLMKEREREGKREGGNEKEGHGGMNGQRQSGECRFP